MKPTPPNSSKTLLACGLACWLASFVTFDMPWASAADPAGHAFFEKHIRPVLIEKCYECHSVATESSGGLNLDSRPGWQRGGDSGPAIVPKQPDQSLLLKAIRYSDSQLKMPPDGQLSAETIRAFEQWIAAGAVDPRSEEPNGKAKQTGLPVEKAREHWSYRPIATPNIPATDAPSQRINAIDAFIQRSLTEQGIETSAMATDRQLLRRLTFDLHGLPPTAEELQAYEADSSVDKYERAVERLLASPRFGERMARRWMDVARYAESVTLRGFVLPQAWRYRDYLIESFNRDQPIDQFVREQVAGDLMLTDDMQERTRRLVATTFLAMGNTNLEEQDKQQLEMDYIDEQLDVLGRVFMGQTLGCARCHDHKFDPIPTKDYYALAGIFRATKAMYHDNVSKWIERPLPLPKSESDRFDSLAERLELIKRVQSSLEKTTSKNKDSTKKDSVSVSNLPGIIVDNDQAQLVGQWKASSSVMAYVGAGYLHDMNDRSAVKSATFEPKQLPPGTYTVRMAYNAAPSRTTRATVRVFSADGEKTVVVNQREPPNIDGLWVSLGEYRFEKDGQAFVLLTNEGADGHVIADAVQFLPKDNIDLPVAKSDATVAESAKTEFRENRLKELKASEPSWKRNWTSNLKSFPFTRYCPRKIYRCIFAATCTTWDLSYRVAFCSVLSSTLLNPLAKTKADVSS